MESRGQWGGGQGELGQEAYKAMERQSSYGEADSGRAATAQSEAYSAQVHAAVQYLLGGVLYGRETLYLANKSGYRAQRSAFPTSNNEYYTYLVIHIMQLAILHVQFTSARRLCSAPKAMQKICVLHQNLVHNLYQLSTN